MGLQIPAAVLGGLISDSDALGGWRPMITDLGRQYASGQEPTDSDPTRRVPGAVLRRYLQIRDRRCIMIGCRSPPAAPTLTTQGTTPAAEPPPSAIRNPGHACRHDHRVKHDGGWRLDQSEPGQFRWTILPDGQVVVDRDE